MVIVVNFFMVIIVVLTHAFILVAGSLEYALDLSYCHYRGHSCKDQITGKEQAQ